MTVEEIRTQIQRNQYPAEFRPHSWKNSIDNCYAYALNLKLPDCYLIGDFIHKRVTNQHSNAEILSVLIEELTTLGFEVTEVDTNVVCPEASQKIFLGRDVEGDYHFIRQDSDGLWSHKSSTSIPHRKDSCGELIYDPETACTTYVVGWCFQLTKKRT